MVPEKGAYNYGRPKQGNLGRCYELSAQKMLGLPDGSLLVHGTIQGEGHPPIGHGWVEAPNGLIWEPLLTRGTTARPSRSSSTPRWARSTPRSMPSRRWSGTGTTARGTATTSMAPTPAQTARSSAVRRRPAGPSPPSHRSDTSPPHRSALPTWQSDAGTLPEGLKFTDQRARAGVTLRPPRDDEFDAMLELMNAHQLAAFGEADYTATTSARG